MKDSIGLLGMPHFQFDGGAWLHLLIPEGILFSISLLLLNDTIMRQFLGPSFVTHNYATTLITHTHITLLRPVSHKTI